MGPRTQCVTVNRREHAHTCSDRLLRGLEELPPTWKEVAEPKGMAGWTPGGQGGLPAGPAAGPAVTATGYRAPHSALQADRSTNKCGRGGNQVALLSVEITPPASHADAEKRLLNDNRILSVPWAVTTSDVFCHQPWVGRQPTPVSRCDPNLRVIRSERQDTQMHRQRTRYHGHGPPSTGNE